MTPEDPPRHHQPDDPVFSDRQPYEAELRDHRPQDEREAAAAELHREPAVDLRAREEEASEVNST